MTERRKCKAQVSDHTGFHFHSCGKLAKYGDYCGIHSPEKRAERKAKRKPTEFERLLAKGKKLSEITEKMKELEKKSKEFLSNFPSHFYEDWGEDHRKADSLLCESLEILGYKTIVDSFNGIAKRYN